MSWETVSVYACAAFCFAMGYVTRGNVDSIRKTRAEIRELKKWLP